MRVLSTFNLSPIWYGVECVWSMMHTVDNSPQILAAASAECNLLAWEIHISPPLLCLIFKKHFSNLFAWTQVKFDFSLKASLNSPPHSLLLFAFSCHLACPNHPQEGGFGGRLLSRWFSVMPAFGIHPMCLPSSWVRVVPRELRLTKKKWWMWWEATAIRLWMFKVHLT